MRTLVRRMLLRSGAKAVVEAEDGEQALRQVDSTIPAINLVLCDWHIRKMSGLHLFNELKTRQREIPFIMNRLCGPRIDCRGEEGRYPRLPHQASVAPRSGSQGRGHGERACRMNPDFHAGATLDYVRAQALHIVGLCYKCGAFDVAVEWLIEQVGEDFPLRDLDLCAVACPACGAASTLLKVSPPKGSERSPATASNEKIVPLASHQVRHSHFVLHMSKAGSQSQVPPRSET